MVGVENVIYWNFVSNSHTDNKCLSIFVDVAFNTMRAFDYAAALHQAQQQAQQQQVQQNQLNQAAAAAAAAQQQQQQQQVHQQLQHTPNSSNKQGKDI